MHILYAVTTCSDQVYHKLFAHTKVKPAFQSQKYHRLLIEGLAEGAEVDVIANPPVNRAVLEREIVRLPKERASGATFHYIPGIRNPILKAAWVGVGTFLKILTMARKDSAVVVDVLNRVTALSAMLAARLRGVPCVGIVTDLPDMLSGSGKKISNFVMKHCTAYVLLTEAMNDYIGNRHKPYVVLEGHSDITMGQKNPSLDRKIKPRVILYAGGISRQYGAYNLLTGFQKANLGENAQLHFYGPGDFVEEVKKAAQVDPRIFYGGMLLSSEVVEKEMEATVLINPRPTTEEFVRYSFPSKTMEYMSTGTPVMTTVLPGMPKEYHPHVFLMPEETAEGIAREMEKVMGYSDEELFQKGMNARRFVLEEKNNVIQARKLLHMLEKMIQGKGQK